LDVSLPPLDGKEMKMKGKVRQRCSLFQKRRYELCFLFLE